MLVWFQTRAGMRRRLTFLGFTIYLAQSWSQKSSKIVFQTEGKRFSRARPRCGSNSIE
jgi:hypothetical protein